MNRKGLAAAGLLALLAVLGVLARIEAPTGDDTPADVPLELSSELRAAVRPEGVLRHERRFQTIAEAHGGDRAAGTAGYDASAEYVAKRLREAGYRVTVQRFEFPASHQSAAAGFELQHPSTESYVRGTDFAPMQYSGAGEVTAAVSPVDAGSGASTSGCEKDDFEGFPPGDVALLRRGTCPFAEKAQNAEAAGASAAVIFNEGGPGRSGVFEGTLGGPGARIPVLGASFEVGSDLADTARDGRATVRVAAGAVSGNSTTSNVIAETRGGDSDNTVVVGAHLDSVTEGPGINDNGSGTSAILEIALQMAELDFEPRNRVRFAFWGAEELGLLGSEHYVQSLSQKQLDDLLVYLNFDMLGSPNHVRSFYGSSEEAKEVFEEYFSSRNLESAQTADLRGRSDHGPFAERGVPTGGLFSGAGGTKTRPEAEAYGGEAGTAYDPCYHEACDDLGNLSEEALGQLSDAAAHAIAVFARTQPR